MRARQAEIFSRSITKNFKSAFGGSDLKSNPKVARPVSTKDLMHVVLKSEKARGAHSFLRQERVLVSLVQSLGRKLGIQVREVVVMSNHIHLLLKISHRRLFKGFLRAINGLIARKILRAERGKSSIVKDFFTGRPFSRIVASGFKSFRDIARYFELNDLEKLGFSMAESRARGLSIRNLPTLDCNQS